MSYVLSKTTEPTGVGVQESNTPNKFEADEMLEGGEDGAVLERYKAMAADHEREANAHEWSEVLIGDGLEAA